MLGPHGWQYKQPLMRIIRSLLRTIPSWANMRDKIK